MVEDKFVPRDTRRLQPQPFARLWDQPQEGYVPIQITPHEHNKCTHFYKYPDGVDITIADALKVLNFPEQQSTNTEGKLLLREIADCSKLSFLLATLTRINQENCNLDLAIIGSTKGIEQLLTDALSLYEQFEFKTMSAQFNLDNPPVRGVLVSFRKNRKSASNFKMAVDYVILYDAAIMDSRSYDDFFRGVYYTKPVVLSLVCLRSPDIRVCNYKDAHMNEIDGNISLLNARFEIGALFFNVIYPKVKVLARQTLNQDMSKRLVSWMVLKDGSKFDPGCSSFTSQIRELEQAATTSASAGIKRSASALNGPSGPSTLPKRRAWDSLKSFGIIRPVELPYETMRLIKARIKSSFPVKELKKDALILDDEVVKGLGWLAASTLITSKEPSISKSKTEMDYPSSSRNVGIRTPSALTYPSTFNTHSVAPPSMSQQLHVSASSSNIPLQSGTPTIHPSRLAIIEVSNKQSFEQEPSYTHKNNASVDNHKNNASDDNHKNNASVDNHPSFTQENDKDIITKPISPAVPAAPTSPAPLTSNEKLPDNHSPSKEREASTDGLNDFEVALERAHLELMRSLMGVGETEGK